MEEEQYRRGIWASRVAIHICTSELGATSSKKNTTSAKMVKLNTFTNKSGQSIEAILREVFELLRGKYVKSPTLRV
jgi:hypothetical protein